MKTGRRPRLRHTFDLALQLYPVTLDLSLQLYPVTLPVFAPNEPIDL